jgi:hypothetical protein
LLQKVRALLRITFSFCGLLIFLKGLRSWFDQAAKEETELSAAASVFPLELPRGKPAEKFLLLVAA